MQIHAVIMAGGTGGHIYPALAVAQELKSRGATVSWLGTQRGLESELVPKANIEIDYINVEGVRGRGFKTLLRAPFVLLKAILQARCVIKRRQANVVVGFGGFVAGPGGVAAKLTGLPLLIHEQNAIAGTTNTLLAKIANKVFTAFPGVFKEASEVGNPVRKSISSLPSPQDRMTQFQHDEPFKLLILGGSLGATAINELVPKAVAEIQGQSGLPLQVLHQCGSKNVEQTELAYKQCGIELNDDINVQPFLEDMAEAYQWANFIVCRAGALTVAEISAAGCASLMVPFPFAIDDHQTANAQWLVQEGAARMCQQNDLTKERLISELMSVINNRDQLLEMAAKARKLAKKDAATMVAQACFEVSKRGQ